MWSISARKVNDHTDGTAPRPKGHNGRIISRLSLLQLDSPLVEVFYRYTQPTD